MGNATFLSGRDNWQDAASQDAKKDETRAAVLLSGFLGDDYMIMTKPKELRRIYGGYGIVPDACVINNVTGKRLYIENKWGKNGGNAHERCYKYLSKPLQSKVRSMFDTPEMPFFWIFSGPTFQKKKYLQEITMMLADYEYNYHVWGHPILDNEVEWTSLVIKDLLS